MSIETILSHILQEFMWQNYENRTTFDQVTASTGREAEGFYETQCSLSFYLGLKKFVVSGNPTDPSFYPRP